MQRFIPWTLALCALLFVGQGCVSLSSGSGLSTSGPAGVYASVDSGESWEKISLLPQADGIKDISSASVFALIQDPKDPDVLYWGSRGQGMFYSIDGGRSWQRPAAPLNTGFVYDISVNAGDTCTIYASTGNAVYRSTDCTRSWERIYQESGNDRVVSVEADPFAPQRIYLAKRGGDVLRSIDGGISWQVAQRFKSTRLVKVLVDPNISDVVYVASSKKGLFRSEDAGQTWTTHSDPFKEFSGAHAYRELMAYPGKEGVLYWISDYGILRSADRGANWKEVPTIPSPGSVKIYSFGLNPDNEKEIFYTATIDERSTLYKTVDGGENWVTKRLPSGQLPTEIVVHPERKGWVYIGFTIPPS